MNRTPLHAAALTLIALLPASLVPAASSPQAAPAEAPSASLLVNRPLNVAARGREEPHALRAMSMFAIAPPEARAFHEHDLIQIIVRESSSAKSEQELEAEKEYELDGSIGAWPELNLAKLLELQLEAGRTNNLPAVNVGLEREFQGEGTYERKDDLVARLTAEVIEILPNGNLVLEGRTFIKTDDEEQTIVVTGVCRPEDVTPVNTVLSNQIHNLQVIKTHEGELRKTTKKGIITKALEALFAF